MLAFQAFANACIFALLTALFTPMGLLSTPVLLLGAVSAMFFLSLLTLNRFGRLPLVATWVAAFVLIGPSLPGGMMDGGMAVGYPAMLYLLAGFLGACFLPKRGLPPVPGAPVDEADARARREGRIW